MNKQTRFAIPTSIDPHLLSDKMGKKDSQKALWLINRLSLLHSIFKRNEWIEIPSSTLNYFLGNNYTYIIKTLEDLNILKVHNTYEVKKHCKGYKLLDKISGRYLPCIDKILAKKMLAELKKKAVDSKLKASSSLDEWLYNNLIDIDIKPIMYENLEYNDWLKLIRSDNAAMLIESGYHTFKVCKYDRRHTPVTRLCKKYRKYLYFKSIPNIDLCEIDIVNSQLVFLLSDIMDQKYDSNYDQKGMVTGGNILCSQKWQEKIIQFKECVEKGEFYDIMMKELGETDRDAFKKNVFKYLLYGKSAAQMGGVERDLPIIKVFKNLFPAIWEYIIAQKAKSYKELSWRMQRKEANFIYNRVIARIIQLYPTTRIVTIHDSFICEKKRVEDIKSIIEDEFINLGIKATLRIGPLNNLLEDKTDSEILDELEEGESEGISNLELETSEIVENN